MTLRPILNIGAAALTLALLLSATARADMNDTEKQQLQQLQQEVDTLKKQMQELIREQRRQPVAPAVAIPPPQPKNVSMGTIPTLGNADAKIALVEFSDYQCPYCERFHAQTFDRIKSKFIDKGKVLYVYHDLPAPNRSQAAKAAVAARCAGAQDKYFEMQKLLFKNGRQLKDESYAVYAKRLGLDAGKFEACMLDNNQVEKVKQDLIEGRDLGIRGTPTFYIGTVNGKQIENVRQIVGALPYSYFKQALEKALQ